MSMFGFRGWQKLLQNYKNRRMQNISHELKDFEIVQTLSEGCCSKVKLVRRAKDGKLLALKQVIMDRLVTAEKHSALNEIRLLASIQSPYVISYQGSFYSHETNSLCLLMEYADGGDLEKLIVKTGKKNKNAKGLPESLVWKIAIELLQGLKNLHENNIVHRDLKPSNVFFVKGTAKIGDLNVSSISDSGMFSTKTGSPHYTAPEIWKQCPYTQNCDVWSLGCIIYEMCSFQAPFKAQSFPELFLAITRGTYSPLSSDYSEDIRTFIRLCLTVDPEDRLKVTELLQNPIIVRKINEMKDQIEFGGQVKLLKPIKCPKILRFLNNVLPQREDETPEALPLNQQDSRTTSITKNKSQTSFKTSKSSIRIRSTNKLPNKSQFKSVKLIPASRQPQPQPVSTKSTRKLPQLQPNPRLRLNTLKAVPSPHPRMII